MTNKDVQELDRLMPIILEVAKLSSRRHAALDEARRIKWPEDKKLVSV